MTRILVSVRGFIDRPHLLEVDLTTQPIVRTIDIDIAAWDFVPETKRGFAGLGWWQDQLVAATWDRLCFIDPATGQICREITDERFSDLHGLAIEADGTIWVTSTNLDGVYTVRDGIVEPFWHAWACPDLGPVSAWQAADYRRMEKDDSPYHRFHVNAVLPTPDYVYVTHLGPTTNPRSVKWRILRRLGAAIPLQDGGVFVLDRRTRQLAKRLRSRGLHDAHLAAGHNAVFYTEFAGNALRRFDLARGTWRRIRLDIPHFSVCGYMTRGVLALEDSFWVGHTVTRSEHIRGHEGNIGRLRNYTLDGHWTGKDIALPGYIGVFDLIPYPAAEG